MTSGRRGANPLLFVLVLVVALARVLLAAPADSGRREHPTRGNGTPPEFSIKKRRRSRRPVAWGLAVLLVSGGLGLGLPAVQLLGGETALSRSQPSAAVSRGEAAAPVRARSDDGPRGVTKTDPPPPPSPEEVAIAVAHEQIGTPYRWAGAGPGGFDCSGLTSFVWRQAGIELPRTSRAQFAALPRVGLDELEPGDLVYSPGHIGLYIGDGRMIHSPRSGRRVEIAPVYSGVIGAVRPSAVISS